MIRVCTSCRLCTWTVARFLKFTTDLKTQRQWMCGSRFQRDQGHLLCVSSLIWEITDYMCHRSICSFQELILLEITSCCFLVIISQPHTVSSTLILMSTFVLNHIKLQLYSSALNSDAYVWVQLQTQNRASAVLAQVGPAVSQRGPLITQCLSLAAVGVWKFPIRKCFIWPRLTSVSNSFMLVSIMLV